MQITNSILLVCGLYGVMIGFAIGYVLATLIWKPLIKHWQEFYTYNDNFYQQHIKEYQEILRNIIQNKT